MRRGLLKKINTLTKDYHGCRPESGKQLMSLKELRCYCRELIETSKGENKLRECCNVIPQFCHEYGVAKKRLDRLLRLKAANKKARSERIGQLLEYFTRRIFFRKSLEI